MRKNEQAARIAKKHEIYNIIKSHGGLASIATIEIDLKRKYPDNVERYSTKKIRALIESLKEHRFVFYNQSLAAWQLTERTLNYTEGDV